MSLVSKLESAASVVLTICAVAVTVSVVRAQFFPTNVRGAGMIEKTENWREYAVGDMVTGSRTSPVTITVFTDYQCPVCASFHETVRRVRSQHSTDVRVVYRNYPLTQIHDLARSAAIAAECAAQSGVFASYSDSLFARKTALDHTNWVLLAAQVGVRDTIAFRGCLNSPTSDARLLADSTAAARLNIDGTPLVLVNSSLIRGAPHDSTLTRLVQAELKGPTGR